MPPFSSYIRKTDLEDSLQVFAVGRFISLAVLPIIKLLVAVLEYYWQSRSPDRAPVVHFLALWGTVGAY